MKYNLPLRLVDQTTSGETKESLVQKIPVMLFLFCFIKTEENELIAKVVQITPGVCIHNGILHKNKEEWTIDSCTECTCQVKTSYSSQHANICI